ncbi:conserved hypothetical protein [Sinorhizobium medicae]|uniref:Uncharacterized protein n=1 Tax=Sinorhizobium medicae TaxID=110321 RepID=A0A508WQ60_9HYPH|nr:conserved hypothetical protein [Sinorhizobium medicae]
MKELPTRGFVLSRSSNREVSQSRTGGPNRLHQRRYLADDDNLGRVLAASDVIDPVFRQAISAASRPGSRGLHD